MNVKQAFVLSVFICFLGGASIGYFFSMSRVRVNVNLVRAWKEVAEECDEARERALAFVEELTATYEYKIGELTYENEELKTNYTILKNHYWSMWEEYDELIKKYNNLSSLAPVGELVVTEILGVFNGDFDNETLGWLREGTTNLNKGVAMLQERSDRSSYISQTVNFDLKDQGLAFSVNPNPLGGEVDFEVYIGEIMVFRDTYTGIVTDYNWTKVVIPIEPVFQMKKLYGLETESLYTIRFSVPLGEYAGAQIFLDNITLVHLEFQPEKTEQS